MRLRFEQVEPEPADECGSQCPYFEPCPCGCGWGLCKEENAIGSSGHRFVSALDPCADEVRAEWGRRLW